jgi:hypothetical protein
MAQRYRSPERAIEPGPGGFDVGERELNATRVRWSTPHHSIAERFDDRRGKIQVPKYEMPGPETSVHESMPSEHFIAGGSFGHATGHNGSVISFADSQVSEAMMMETSLRGGL